MAAVSGDSSVDPEEWDNFVAGIPGDTVQQTCMWARAKSNRYEHSIKVVRSDGLIVGGALLLHTKKAGIDIAYAPRGPLVLANNEAAIEPLLASLIGADQRSRLSAVVVQPVEETPGLVEGLSRCGFTPAPLDVATPATAEIILDVDDAQLMANMNSSRRQDIRKAEKLGVQVRTCGPEDFETFHRLHSASAQRQGFTPMSVDYLRRQADCLGHRNAFVMYLAELDGEALAGATVTAFGDRVVYKLTGMAPTKAARDGRATTYLQWRIMSDARSEGFAYYDLGGFDKQAAKIMIEGGETPEHVRRSPLQFKLSLGGQVRLSPGAWWRLSSGLLRALQEPVASLVERSSPVRNALLRFRD